MNTIQIDKIPNGSTDNFRLSWNTDVQNVIMFETFDDLAAFLVDNGFLPQPTT